jgi:hypothetical protein
MQMEMFCANEACKHHTVRVGGRFSYRGGKWYCADCTANNVVAEPGKNLWEFESMNIGSDPNAGPVKVTSLRHLRQLEKQHGVISVAANYDSARW